MARTAMAVHPAMEQTAHRAVDPMVPADPAAPAGHQGAPAAVDPAAADLAARVAAAAVAEVAANRGSDKGGIDGRLPYGLSVSPQLSAT